MSRFVPLALFALAIVLRAAQPPNIVFILTDDQGWTDLGCCGSDFYETPRIDQLARQGMRFTDAYAACNVCSPSRAAIMTGQYPARLHITDWISGHKFPKAPLQVPAWTMQLSPAIPNLPQALKRMGYATASIGKWHLGPPTCWPEQQGFDLNIAGCEKGHQPSYFSPYKLPTLKDGPPGEFLPDRLTDEALKFIEKHRARPFFIYLSHYAVHTPLDSKKELRDKYRAKQDKSKPHRNANYAALIESVDEGVGRILDKLEELQLTANTVVVFTSDNGGLIGCTSNQPLRAGKGTAYEGGVRVPLIVRWPNVIKANTLCSVPVIGCDFYPTFLTLAGTQPAATYPGDGVDLGPVLRGAPSLPREALYWHYPHYHPAGAKPHGIVRWGDYRLIEFYEDQRVELYRLSDDLGEERDLVALMPEKAVALKQMLHAWRTQVKAQMPSTNPNYQPSNVQ